MSLSSLRLFNAVIEKERSREPYVVKEYGVLVSAKAAYDHRNIALHLRQQGVGVAERNSSFWSSWEKISHAYDFELIIDQLLHYLSTYGFESLGINSTKEGLVYIPEAVFDGRTSLTMRLIDTISTEEAIKRCFVLLESGVALSQETLDDIISVLFECNYEISGEIKIRNKEAQAMFYKLAGVLPTNGDELFRYLIYLFTNETLVINNPAKRSQITASRVVIPNLDDKRMLMLAQSFNRHRDLWMAMKKANPRNRSVVNRLSRLSKSHHQPLIQNPLNLLTTGRVEVKTLDLVLSKATTYQLVRAYNALALRGAEPRGAVYRIRNGKSWVTEQSPKSIVNADEYMLVLLEELEQRFKDVTVVVDPFVDYAFPTSEKSFVGNIPNGTVLRFNETEHNLCIGVHWEDPYTDLDFTADNSNFRLGWNTAFRNDERTIMHSGDMTRAPQPYGATEWIYTKKLEGVYSLKVNLYSGYDFSKHFKFIIGVSESSPKSDTRIAPENILCSFDVPMNSKQMDIGLLYPDDSGNICLMLGTSETGNRRVSRYNKFDTVRQDVYGKELLSGLRLTTVIRTVTKNKKGAIDLRLNNLKKDSILGIL